MSQFDSVGANTDGTIKIADRRSLTKSSPIPASFEGGGAARQFRGSRAAGKDSRETLSGTSARTNTRSSGGSLALIWTKYSMIASDKCSEVYARRTPGLDQRPPYR